jgi:hypothetical protein
MAQFLYGKKCKLPNLAFAVPVSPNSTFAEQGSGFADYKKSWKGLGDLYNGESKKQGGQHA